MCNLSWTPHSNLEKDNSLKTTPVLAQRWAVWSILTKNTRANIARAKYIPGYFSSDYIRVASTLHYAIT